MRIWFSALALLLLTSCTELLYRSNMQNVPLIKEKNELKANLNISNFQLAYAPASNIAVMANGYYFQELLEGQSQARISQFVAEGGVGVFKNIDEALTADFFIGAGYGRMEQLDRRQLTQAPIQMNHYQADYLKLFAQPSIGFSTDVVDIAFSPRISMLRFSNFRTDFSNIALQEAGLPYHLNDTHILLEPGVTARFGYKYVKAQIQVINPQLLNFANFNYRRMVLNMAIHINLAPRFHQQ